MSEISLCVQILFLRNILIVRYIQHYSEFCLILITAKDKFSTFLLYTIKITLWDCCNREAAPFSSNLSRPTETNFLKRAIDSQSTSISSYKCLYFWIWETLEYETYSLLSLPTNTIEIIAATPSIAFAWLSSFMKITRNVPSQGWNFIHDSISVIFLINSF